MGLKAEVVLEWGGGEHLFALKGKEIEELQSVCGKIGFAAIYQRVMVGQWFWADLYHTIRLGLIGGGMGQVEAKRLTDFYMGSEAGENRSPLAAGPNSPVSVARAIMVAVMNGMDDIPTGESAPGKARRATTPKKKSTSRSIERRSSKRV